MAQKTYTDDVILACLDVEHYDVTSDTWYPVPNCTDVGALGEQAEKKEKTNLSNKLKTYGEGLQDAPDKAIKGQYIPPQTVGSPYEQAYIDQQRFIKRCRNREEFFIRVRWASGSTNSFLFKSLGFEFDSPNQAEWKMWTSNGSQNTRMLWEVDVTGLDTVAVAATVQLTAATDPVDLELQSGEAFAWESSDTDVATVDTVTGVVTGVAVGEVEITSEIRGVTGYHTVTVTA